MSFGAVRGVVQDLDQILLGLSVAAEPDIDFTALEQSGGVLGIPLQSFREYFLGPVELVWSQIGRDHPAARQSVSGVFLRQSLKLANSFIHSSLVHQEKGITRLIRLI